MSTFKEDVFEDVDVTFMELTEFADIHNIDGVEMPAVIDDYEATRRAPRSTNEIEGVHQKSILVFAPRKYFDVKPSVGTRILKLDNKRYQIEEVDEEGDVYAITLRKYSGKASGR